MDLRAFKESVVVKIQSLIKKKSLPKELGNHILLKYIFKELFNYFIIAFLFLFVIFFVNNILLIGEDLLKKHAPINDVMLVMLYSIPSIVAQSTPFATLIGFLMCLGRMMSDNEILIIRASGFGYKYIFIPVVTLGILIFVVSFFVNDYLQVLSNVKYRQLLSKISRSTPTIVLEPNSIKKLGQSTVIIGDVEGNNVSDVIFFNSDNTDSKSIIVAKNSTLKDSKKDGVVLQLDMSDAVMLSVKSNKTDYDVLESQSILLNIFDTDFLGRVSQTASTYTYFDLKKEINKMKKQNLADDQTVNQWSMELYKKISLPFVSVLFAFLAFSIAFLFGKHNGLTMGLFTGVIICVLYWAMQITGQLLVVHNQYNAFWCIWASDIVIALAALILGVILVKK
ncbi:MAG: LptF/LptG family permease [Treponema sp.]|nr:LptF/LptG family permease [Treponema sp.]